MCWLMPWNANKIAEMNKKVKIQIYMCFSFAQKLYLFIILSDKTFHV